MGEKFTYEKKIEDMKDEDVNGQQQKVKSWKMPNIRALQYAYIGTEEVVQYKTNELTALCPMTGLPDLYELIVRYIPNNQIPELKSLKEYLGAYRDLPIFHEHLVNKIWNELFETIEPKALSVEVQVAIRGGIATTVMRSKGFKFVGV